MTNFIEAEGWVLNVLTSGIRLEFNTVVPDSYNETNNKSAIQETSFLQEKIVEWVQLFNRRFKRSTDRNEFQWMKTYQIQDTSVIADTNISYSGYLSGCQTHFKDKSFSYCGWMSRIFNVAWVQRFHGRYI